MARRRVAGRGRGAVAVALLTFLLVTSIVIWRRTAGIEESRALRELERERTELQAARARLARDIRDASSRARLVPIAERRLGMRPASASEIVLLERPAPR